MQQLEYYAASRVCSTVDCFAQICGDWRHHLSPSVGWLAVYRENKKIVLIHPKSNAKERLNQSSPLERHFLRPRTAEDDDLTFAQYFSLFQITKHNEGIQNECPQPHHIVPQSNPAIFILKDMHFSEHERFCFRIRFWNIPTRSWQALRTRRRPQLARIYIFLFLSDAVKLVKSSNALIPEIPTKQISPF
jgi:hypothetical protein